MKKQIIIGWIISMLAASMPLLAQTHTVSPVVPDFTDIKASHVVATYGTTDDPYKKLGLVSGRHEVISAQGTDSYTGGDLKFLPPGEAKVVKLGNSQVGSEAESITYHFIVDPDKTILFLKFAIVVQDPSHDFIYQPRFIVRIMNKEGDLIDDCAEYDVSARAGIEGFQTYNKFGTPIRWRDWTNVGLDMSSYAGQEVQVQFTTYDCVLTAHFGYAYFTATCISQWLALENCIGDEFTVSAPEGFSSYLWQDGRTTPSTTWVKGDEDMNLSCEVTSATGCRFTLSAYVSSDEELPDDPVIYDTICQGDAYTKYNFNLPPQNESGTFRYTNTYLNPQDCKSGGTKTLFLTVLQRYYPIIVELCPGESYVENGFSYVEPAPGIYLDSLYYLRDGYECDSIVTLQLTVFPEVSMSVKIEGDMQPCVGSIQTYSISEDLKDDRYLWQFPDGFYILSGEADKEVLVQVTDAAKNGTVSLKLGTKGCAFGLEPFVVEPNPAYWKTLLDTICSGLEYRENGFNVSRQDSPGSKVFTQYNVTTKGCDSIVTLHLFVSRTPSVRIVASDSVVCEGDPVKLEALGSGSMFLSDTVYLPVAIGDILCKDGSIVKPNRYRPGVHIAKGIVFYVHENGWHGWAVHLEDQAQRCEWAYRNEDIPDLPNSLNNQTMALDTSGYKNTRAIRRAGDGNVYAAAYLVDFPNGWYIPAMGQLIQLYSYLSDINASLTIAGGRPIQFQSQEYYWSSSEFSADRVWIETIKGIGEPQRKTVLLSGRLRSICSF